MARQKQVGRATEQIARAGTRLKLRTVSKTVRLTQANWDLVDRNRIPMQLSESQYIAYCVRKVAKPYDVARAKQLEVARGGSDG